MSLLLLLALLSPRASAQAVVKGERVEFKSDDGWTLVGEFWRGLPDKPTFILVHGAGGRRKDWEPLRRALFAHGYGAFVYDSRGHGDSTAGPSGPMTSRVFKREGQDNEWNQMSLDLDAVSRELAARGVAVSSVGVIGSAVGANVGLKWAAVHHETLLTVLLSPGINHHDVLSVGAMRAYGPRPVLIIVGEDDRPLVLAGKVIYDNARFHSGDAYAAFWIVPKGQGIAMLTPDLVHRIIEWLAAPMKAPDVSTSTPTIQGSSAPTQGAYNPGPPPPLEGIR